MNKCNEKWFRKRKLWLDKMKKLAFLFKRFLKGNFKKANATKHKKKSLLINY